MHFSKTPCVSSFCVLRVGKVPLLTTDADRDYFFLLAHQPLSLLGTALALVAQAESLYFCLTLAPGPFIPLLAGFYPPETRHGEIDIYSNLVSTQSMWTHEYEPALPAQHTQMQALC